MTPETHHFNVSERVQETFGRSAPEEDGFLYGRVVRITLLAAGSSTIPQDDFSDDCNWSSHTRCDYQVRLPYPGHHNSALGMTYLEISQCWLIWLHYCDYYSVMYHVWKIGPQTRVHYMLKLTQNIQIKITCSRSARQIAQYIWSHSTLIRTAQRKQIVWSHLPTANISIRSWQTGHEDSSSLRCILVSLPVAIISTRLFHFNTSHHLMTSTRQNKNRWFDFTTDVNTRYATQTWRIMLKIDSWRLGMKIIRLRLLRSSYIKT